jgi:hypothetical protein
VTFESSPGNQISKGTILGTEFISLVPKYAVMQGRYSEVLNVFSMKDLYNAILETSYTLLLD